METRKPYPSDLTDAQFERIAPYLPQGVEEVRLEAPGGLALDGKGNLLIVDTGNKRIIETKLP